MGRCEHHDRPDDGPDPLLGPFHGSGRSRDPVRSVRQRLPAVSVTADYGGGGPNLGNFNQVYTVAGNVSMPLYTGGRIRADIQQAQADVARRQARPPD